MKNLNKMSADNTESFDIDISKESLALGDLESSMIRERFYSGIEGNPLLNEIEVNDKVKEVLEKILGKCLESRNMLYGIDQESLKGKNLEEHFDALSEDHPELWGILNFDLQLGDIICLNYEDCKPSDKIRLVALMSALDENKVFPNSHINEDGSFNVEKKSKKEKIKLIDKRLDEIKGSFAKVTKHIIIHSLEEERARLEEQKQILQQETNDDLLNDKEFKELYNRFIQIIECPIAIWELGNKELRDMLIGVLFGGKIYYTKNERYETPHKSLVYSMLDQFNGDDSPMGRSTGLEPAILGTTNRCFTS